MKIKQIQSIQIINSRAIPTLKTYVLLDDGNMGWAMVPQGASRGKKEAIEIYDQEKNLFLGLSLRKNIEIIETTINAALKGINIDDQKAIDQKLIELDGTENKEKLGANTILSVSLACVRAAANIKKIELYEQISQLYGQKNYQLPTPLFNFINGGAHAFNNLDIQEFMVIPKTQSFFSAIRIADEVYLTLKEILKVKKQSLGLGDEGGFSPNLLNDEKALELLMQAAKQSQNLEKIVLGLDSAAGNFYQTASNIYTIDQKQLSSDDLIAYYQNLTAKFPIVSLEDPLQEDDLSSWGKLKQTMPKTQIVGDDLFVTNPKIIQERKGLANAIIIKPNQIGTISETLEAIKISREQKMKIIISHRSGETEDPFIADLAVGVGAEEVKFGSIARSERLAKYNRLLEIEALNSLPYHQAL